MFQQACLDAGGAVGPGPCCKLPTGNLSLSAGQMIPVPTCAATAAAGGGSNLPLIIGGVAVGALVLTKFL
jgi:hypothetical protein